MTKNLLKAYKESGTKGLYYAIRFAILRRLICGYEKRAKCYSKTKKLVASGIGLEIGGPSNAFMRCELLPIYPIIKRLDNCNFSASTIWEGAIDKGMTFEYDSKRPVGRQFITDASNLIELPSSTYDFILSCHALEHIANPIKALKNWIGTLKDDGKLVLIVPHKNGAFDHKRPITTLEHLLDDYENDVDEDDLTHLPEILELHDLERDPDAGSFEDFRSRSEKNLENRCLHHHVFDEDLVSRLLTYMNFKIHVIECVQDFHVIAIAQKISDP